MTDKNRSQDADLDALLGNTPNTPAAAAPRHGAKTTAKVAPRQPAPKAPVVNNEDDDNAPEPEFIPKVDKVATAAPRKNTVRILIDDVDGKANNEVVGVNGVVYQIKRGEPVEVPLSVVRVLETALMTKTVQSVDRVTGEVINTFKDSSAIPWRRV